MTRDKVRVRKGCSNFKFGNGGVLPSFNYLELSCVLGGKNIKLGVNVVDLDILIFLSKEAMKKAGTVFNFSIETIISFGTIQKSF